MRLHMLHLAADGTDGHVYIICLSCSHLIVGGEACPVELAANGQ